MEISEERNAAIVAEKIIQAVRVPCDVGGEAIQVNTSIGIAIFPGDGTTAEALITSADIAMYRAKQNQSGYAFAGDNAAP